MAAEAQARIRREDQSYFLFSLTQDQLEGAGRYFRLERSPSLSCAARHVVSGLAGRREARKPRRSVSFRTGDYAAFIERREPAVVRGGAIVDEGGHQIGTHGGIHRFTMGQRKGTWDCVNDSGVVAWWGSTPMRER
jgi:tRNA-specific 2-thiouridylase